MNLQRFRRRHPGWARFLLLDGNHQSPQPRRVARWLMSIASLGVFFTVIVGIGSMALVLGGMSNPHSATFRDLQIPLHSLPRAWMVAELLAIYLVQILTLWWLRQLARALHEGLLLSVAVARRFRTLGNWLALSLTLGLLFGIGDFMFMPAAQFSLDEGWLTTVILALLCWTVSSIVHEGARAADENRGFV